MSYQKDSWNHQEIGSPPPFYDKNDLQSTKRRRAETFWPDGQQSTGDRERIDCRPYHATVAIE